MILIFVGCGWLAMTLTGGFSGGGGGGLGLVLGSVFEPVFQMGCVLLLIRRKRKETVVGLVLRMTAQE